MILSTLFCMSMAMHNGSPQSHTKFEMAKTISKKYHISRGDAWTIVDSAMRYSKRYDVPIEVVFAVITAESAFNKNAVSRVGAIGLMQVMPRTAHQIAVEVKCGKYDIRNIDTNIRFGTWYLKQMKKRYGNYALAVRAYNCGPKRVDKVLAGLSDYPEETKDYHDKVIALAIVSQMAMPYLNVHR